MSQRRAGSAFFATAPALLFFAILLPHAVIADVILGSNDDTLILNGSSRLSSEVISGGPGNDRLQLSHQLLRNPGRLRQWESIHLSDDSSLEFDSNLMLGGSDALPGQLLVDQSSALLLPQYNAAIYPSAGQQISVINHGLIDLRGPTANQLAINGNYRGSGSIYLDVVLKDDDSVADKLVIYGGDVSGSSQLLFNRFHSSGAPTESGILVVEALDGATTSGDAFYMRDSLSAGPYEYFLFRGSDSSDPQEANNWYLRSTLQPGSTAPSTSASSAPAISDADNSNNSDSIAASTNTTAGANNGNSPDSPVAAAPPPGAKPTPLYRPEIPMYAQAKSLARLTSLKEISTFHDRRGDQRSWLDGSNSDWMRVYHQSTDFNLSGDIENRFDGSISGFQIGRNLYNQPTCSGGAREMGLFVGSSRASGDVSGFVRGFNDYYSGTNELNSYHASFYFNNYRPDQSYLDLVVKVAYLKLESRSFRQIEANVNGPQLTVSVEKAFTVPASQHFNLEPQLQVAVNYSNLSAYNDGISKVEPDMAPEANFRAGLRGYNTQGKNQYYLFGNIWHTLGGSDQLLFDSKVRLDLERRATWGEFGAGVVLLERSLGSAFFNLSYQRSLDSLNWSGGSANLGFNWAW